MEIHKPTTEGCEKVEEGTTASGKDVRTVGKSTGKALDMQNVQDITETIMEERVIEGIPQTHGSKSHNTCQQRHKMTGELSKCTGEVRQ